jgi:cephalosporin hydroxylase
MTIETRAQPYVAPPETEVRRGEHAPGCAAEARGRSFSSIIPGAVLDRLQLGTLRQVYRGVPFYKSPFDIALYLNLLSNLRPKTIIEIGTKHGGSALWFADMLTTHGITEGHVYSVDINSLAAFTDPRISFIAGDAKALELAFSADMLRAVPRPLLVIDDSSHMYEDATAVLQFFHLHLNSGDYIVIEDGVLIQFTDPLYDRYKNGPNRAIADFLAQHQDYAIDEALCDHFGKNVTWNPNAWLRRL